MFKDTQVYSNFIEHLPIGLIIWHLPDLKNVNSFKLTAVNLMARQILKLPPKISFNETDLFQKIDDPFPGFLKLESLEMYADIIRSHQSKDLGEVHYREANEPERIFLVKAFPLEDQQICMIFEDATERKLAEESLRLYERKLHFHVQQTPLGVIEWNTDFTVVEWNTAAEKIFGYTKEEAIGKRAVDLITPADTKDDFNDIFQEILVKKKSISTIIENVHADHKTMICEWHSTPLINEFGDIIAVTSLVSDITDRKTAEQALAEFNARLTQSNRELQDFAFVASHDLQEPLRKIQAFGDRLKARYADALADEGRDYLERMQGAAKRMQTLINDLLAFSRITTKAQPFVKVDLMQIMSEVISDLEVGIQQVKAQVEVQDLPSIDADPLQMRQLFQNLLSNALKFHRADVLPLIQIRGKVLKPSQIPSTLQATDRPFIGSVCLIEVTDNGIGFDEKYLDRIFTVFQRLHGRGEYEGTGVGLAICRKIAERHGGAISANSEPGAGTTFMVALPLKQLGMMKF
ncbi:MAG TPA: ATP-binding protein [Trichocoleus sp.]|jgi:PAS domain S-box-containing protein